MPVYRDPHTGAPALWDRDPGLNRAQMERRFGPGAKIQQTGDGRFTVRVPNRPPVAEPGGAPSVAGGAPSPPGGAPSPSSTPVGGKGIARNDKGQALTWKVRPSFDSAALSLKYGRGAEVVKLGGGKGFGIKLGRPTTIDQRRPDDLIGVEGVRGGYKKPPRVNPENWVIHQGRFGESYFIEPRTELTGLDPQMRRDVRAYDAETERGKGVFGKVREGMDETTGAITGAGDRLVTRIGEGAARAREQGTDRLSRFDAETARIEGMFDERLANRSDPANDIRAAYNAAADRLAEENPAVAEQLRLLADAAGDGYDVTDPTAALVADAQESGASTAAVNAIAELAARPETLRATGEEQAQRASATSGDQDIEAQKAQALAQRAQQRQQLEGDIADRGRYYEGETFNREQSLADARRSRESLRESVNTSEEGFNADRQDARSGLIAGYRQQIQAAQEARAEALREQQWRQQQLAAQLRGQNLQLVGTQITTAGQNDRTQLQEQGRNSRALLDAETAAQERVRKLTEHREKLAARLEEERGRNTRKAAELSVQLRQAGAGLAKAKKAAKQERRQQMKRARSELRALLSGQLTTLVDDGRGGKVRVEARSQFGSKADLISATQAEYPALSPKSVRKLVDGILRAYRLGGTPVPQALGGRDSSRPGLSEVG